MNPQTHQPNFRKPNFRTGRALERASKRPPAAARRIYRRMLQGQPRLAVLGPAMDGGGAVAAAEDAADGDDGDIDQQVLAIASVPRVGERFEVGADAADIDELGHGRHPGIGR